MNPAYSPFCKSCGSVVAPIISKKVGQNTLLWAVFLFLFTGFLCFLPFVMDRCKNTVLNCASCGIKISEIEAHCC